MQLDWVYTSVDEIWLWTFSTLPHHEYIGGGEDPADVPNESISQLLSLLKRSAGPRFNLPGLGAARREDDGELMIANPGMVVVSIWEWTRSRFVSILQRRKTRMKKRELDLGFPC